MEIRLVKTHVLEAHMSQSGDFSDEVRCKPLYMEGQVRNFAVMFDVKAVFSPSGSLSLKYMALFETTDDINEEFRESHFPRVNAPAVAYPYVRAFIAQFSALVGADVYTLPIRNFVKTPPKAPASLPPPPRPGD